ncbi:MAG UNVERIFIED_CONTAM: hypothetical protein LVR18_30390 [Planctomycetaceae bacterium]|jgi:hypothetical protein
MRSEITKVNLEILRHGPAHNQPLSPLTNYLALCGNHGATSVRVPFEHREFETRLRPLMYQESEQLRPPATATYSCGDARHPAGNSGPDCGAG